MAKTSPGEFIRQVRSEASKVVWPTWNETVRTAIEAYGRLDVVALNAGIGSGLGPTDPLDLEAYRRIVGVRRGRRSRGGSRACR